jgi:hypothetical protein
LLWSGSGTIAPPRWSSVACSRPIRPIRWRSITWSRWRAAPAHRRRGDRRSALVAARPTTLRAARRSRSRRALRRAGAHAPSPPRRPPRRPRGARFSVPATGRRRDLGLCSTPRGRDQSLDPRGDAGVLTRRPALLPSLAERARATPPRTARRGHRAVLLLARAAAPRRPARRRLCATAPPGDARRGGRQSALAECSSAGAAIRRRRSGAATRRRSRPVADRGACRPGAGPPARAPDRRRRRAAQRGLAITRAPPAAVALGAARAERMRGGALPAPTRRQLPPGAGGCR